jgi:hypothetical protein
MKANNCWLIFQKRRYAPDGRLLMASTCPLFSNVQVITFRIPPHLLSTLSIDRYWMKQQLVGIFEGNGQKILNNIIMTEEKLIEARKLSSKLSVLTEALQTLERVKFHSLSSEDAPFNLEATRRLNRVLEDVCMVVDISFIVGLLKAKAQTALKEFTDKFEEL